MEIRGKTALRPGRVVGGRYEITAHVGAQYGIHRYHAQESSGRAVTLLASDTSAASHLAQVSEILHNANHPALPKVLESFDSESSTFVVLSVVQGTPLMEMWQNTSVSEEHRLTWLIELCDALQALDVVGAVAGALPPQSVSVVESRVVLADPTGFLVPIVPLESGALPFRYAAPELFVAPLQTSSSASVYALGALMASLILGRQLRDDDLRDDTLRPIRELVPTVAPEIEALLLRAMHSDPEMRPASTSLLREFLSSFRALLGIRLIPGAATNIGLIRLANEDRYLFRQVARQSPGGELSVVLVAVADGIGGEEGGEVASRVALESLEAFFAPRLNDLLAKALEGGEQHDVFHLLQQAADGADREIRECAESNPDLRDMGTTLAVALLIGDGVYVGNSGDSRVYRVGRDSLRQLSEDHTIVAEMVRRGELNAADAMAHPDRRSLTRALGYGSPGLFFAEARIEEGYGLLLCTDGLTEAINDEQVADTFAVLQDPEVVCRQLVHLANLVGGPDNITVVAVRRVPRRLFGIRDVALENAVYCHQCGTRNVQSAQSCRVCGTGLRMGIHVELPMLGVVCPSCNAVNSRESQMCSTCGWLLPLVSGTVFDSRFRIVRMLGQGGMGRAYLVHDIQANEQRVMKELITDVQSSPRAGENHKRYFRNEAAIQSRLRGLKAIPNLIEPVKEHDGRLYFLMEYVAGDDLGKVMASRRRPFPPDQVREWAIQLCEVLTRLHTYRRGAFIVHRDIAPENIRLHSAGMEAGEVTLMDFGVAILAEQGPARTPGLGRQGYAAPEQMLGKADPRSDLYSLAAVMHYLLTCRDPGSEPPPFPPAAELNTLVPEWLSDVIAINLQEKSDARYPSALVLKGDLEQGAVSLTLTCPQCGHKNPRHLSRCRRDGAALV